MADKISGYVRSGLDIRPAKAGGAPRGQAAGQTEAGAAGKPAASAGGDRFQLTGPASVLRQAEARLAAIPDVDAARVESVRQRLAAGDYSIDAERVATKLLGFERELG